MYFRRRFFSLVLLGTLLGAGAAALIAAEVPRGAPTVVQTGTKARISRDDCRRVVEHVARADVEYQPGVDVHGRPVVPAETDGSIRLEPPEEYVIDFEIDLRLRGLVPQPDKKLDLQLGQIEIRNNRAYLNGQPLFDEAEAILAEKCRERLAR
ncbi:MAG: hypothetical protein QNJ94_15880 [Alphaproteobacteria bacterium]|nr:hypothetical protein [Alphaproteobacteria bacterium]